ncbi:MAG: hypothetical protein ACRDTG_29760 [Pseudonocardiaceae bacterium]
MSRSSEPSERTQHSVAELLARYGEATPSTGRRRRRASEDDDSGPQSIIERVRTDDAPMSVVDRLPTQSSRGDRGPHAFDSRDAFDNRDWMDTDLVGRGWDDRGSQTYPSSYSTAGSYSTSADLHEDSWMGLPPVGPGPEPLNGRALSSGPSTDRFPRLDPLSHRPVPFPPIEHQPRNAEPLAGLGTATRPVPRPDWELGNAPVPVLDETSLIGTALGRSASYLAPDRSETLHPKAPRVEALRVEALSVETPRIEVPRIEVPRIEAPRIEAPSAAASDAELLDIEEPDLDVHHAEAAESEQPTSAVREWVMTVTQIGVGVVGGAALWLICEWLWQQMPVVALVVALAVITGLVWVVRRVRRTEDLQTTVIAVLVGLFVTVSPAALLLVGR